MRQSAPTYWALDRNGGDQVLVTPENRQLYSNSVRYIRLHSEPTPTEEEIPEILEKQYSEGLKRKDFTQQDIDTASEHLTGRRFRRRSQNLPVELPPDLVPPTTATAQNTAQASPDSVQLVEGEPTEPKTKKSEAKKKSTAKKAK